MYYTFLVCVCSLRYPAWNAHAYYCRLWPVPPYNIPRHFLTNTKAVPCGRADKETDMTKPIVTFRNFAYASKKGGKYALICYSVSWFIYVYQLFTHKISWKLSTSKLNALPAINVTWHVNDFLGVASSGYKRKFSRFFHRRMFGKNWSNAKKRNIAALI